MAGLTDDQLKAMIDAEMRQSVGFYGGKMAEQRRKAEYYFLGLPKGDLSPPDIDGRSNFVDTTVRTTILWMQPTLIKTFCAGDNVVEFAPQSPDDDDKAKLATDYINYIFYKQNPGFQIVNTWFTDALLQKVGILKVWWDNRQIETKEDYTGLNDAELTQILDDDEVEPVNHRQYEDEEAAEQKQAALSQFNIQMQQAQQSAQQGNPQAQQALAQMQAQFASMQAQPVASLHDVTVKRTKEQSQVRIENVPPEEFMISKKAKSIAEAPFVGHRLMRTVSDLNAMGYKNVDQISSDQSASMLSMEAVERVSFDDESPYLNFGQDQTSNDPSQRIVWLTECYMKVDVDGTGIAEWRKIVKAGNQILENVECDGPPFVSITPIPLPHRFFGLSIADLAMESQKVQTSIIRARLDNLYLQVNGRSFAVDGQVNLDDLLTSRPGGIVRVKQPGAVGPLHQGASDSRGAEAIQQWAQEYAENSTGMTRFTQGGNSDALNHTATGMNIITNKADARIELIARQFAETGFTDLFKLILKLICQHQKKETMIRLSGKFVPIDPREWRNQFDLNINVGLGTGNKDQQLQHLQAIQATQEKSFQLGVATPKNVYNAALKLSEAMGFKNGDQFFTDPTAPKDPNAPPEPEKPDPAAIAAQAEDAKHQREMQFQQQSAQMKMQSDMQAAQLKQQFDGQRLQFEMQQKAQMEELNRNHAMALEQTKMQMQQDVDRNRQAVEAEQKTMELQQQAQLEQLKAQFASQHEMGKLELAKWQTEQDVLNKTQIAQIAAQSRIVVAKIAHQQAVDETMEDFSMMAPPFVPEIAEPELMETMEETDTESNQIALAMLSIADALKELRAPRQIVRDANGKAQGII